MEKIESGHFYHIYNRGNNRENLFKEEINYNYFLLLLQKHLLPIAEIFSYCLLKNHFHLLVRVNETTEDRDFPQAFSNMCNAYTKAINKKYERTGSLFENRYRRRKISDENDLRNVILYINLNPVYHRFIRNIYEYKHSSLPILLSYKKTFIKRDEVLNFFDGRDNLRYNVDAKVWSSMNI
jgi:REP element-mobilizing transposase RayT